MNDFCLSEYENLLAVIEQNKISKQMRSASHISIILRHDVDRAPNKALNMARLESKYYVQSTYYFRIINKCYKPELTKEIHDLGHRIGYHYENLSSVAKQLGLKRKELKDINKVLMPALQNTLGKRDNRNKEQFEDVIYNIEQHLKANVVNLFETAIKDFEINLGKLSKIVPINTISMHGSPLSPIDNRLLWLKYDYRDYGIEFEPYFDFDFDQIIYITDAGRRWNDPKINIKDHFFTNQEVNINSLEDVLSLIQDNPYKKSIVLNIHPEHWAKNSLDDIYLSTYRYFRNFVKKIYIKR